MTTSIKRKAGGVASRPAFKCTNYERHTTAQRRDPQAGKWLAVLLYNLGLRSLEKTEQEFARHAGWRSA